MTLTGGLYDWATYIPGPPEKMYPTPNFARGWALHSMEGTVASGERELMNPARQASWCGSLPRGGGLRQHYPIFAACWASGNRQANMTLVGWELEGFAGEPATPEQVATLLRMRDDWQAAGRPYLQREDTRTLWEHNEVATWVVPNAGPTACPSGRYAPFYAALLEDAMTPAEKAQMEAIVKHLGGMQRIVDIDNAATVDALNEAILREKARIDSTAEFIANLSAAYDLHTHPVAEIGHITTGGPQ